MRDGERGRAGDALRMRAGEHRGGLRAAEPARILDLLGVDGDLFGQRLRMAADHQRHREGPRLRGEIGHAPADDAGLLLDLAAHRGLDRLAVLDEARERRIDATGEARAASEEAAIAPDGEHDRDRIGARKCCVLQLAQSRRKPDTEALLAAPQLAQKRWR